MSKASLAENLYKNLPIPLQNLACSYYGKQEIKARFGPLFHQYLDELMESEKMSTAEIAAFQDEKLGALIKYSYENVPYYREVMDGLKLKPQDIRSRADLVKLPILTKEDVRNNVEKLVSTAVDKKDLVFRHTSGTTGKSLHFYADKATIPLQWALWWRHRQRFGMHLGDLHANFTGKMIVPPDQNYSPYWRWNRPQNQALINMHHLTPEKIADVVGFLGQHPFKFYSGYPSIIHALALIAKEAGVKLESSPQFIVTGAENVLDYQRKNIQEFTGAIMTDQYGFSEGCGNASHCPELVYHEDFEFGIMECVNPESVGDGRERGQIVCTGFGSQGFPFIRYNVGDVGTWEDPQKVCKCGRESAMIVSIEGRQDDYVITPEGRHIMRFDYVFKETQGVKESQIVQEKLGEVKVRIVKRSSYTSADEAFIANEIHDWISPQLAVKFEYIDEIERESNGKFRAVKSLLRAQANEEKQT